MDIKIFNPAETANQLKEMEFRELGGFNEGGAGVFWSEKGGPSPWEMHPDCDELLHVIEGETDVELLPNDGGEPFVANVKTGWYLVVPRACWHRQTIRSRTREFYLTPGRSLHSRAKDPRQS